MHFHDPFLSPGDPASDLPDPMEHASFCLLRALYLILEGSYLKTIYIYKSVHILWKILPSPTLSALHLSLDLMSCTIIYPSLAFLYSFSYTRSILIMALCIYNLVSIYEVE